MARVLITGGAGFLGSHLARRCLDRGDEVHVVVRPSTRLDPLASIAARISVHKVTLTDPVAVARCIEAILPERIFHFAAATRRREAADLDEIVEAIGDDLMGLAVLLRAAARAGRPADVLLRAGSLAEYGFSHTPAVETQRERPCSAYAAQLVAGTHMMQSLQGRLPFPAMTARLALLYGPGQSERFFVADAVRRACEGQPIRLRRPLDRRDLLFVEDAVDALETLAAAPRDGAVVNVGTGRAPTMREAALGILQTTGADPALLSIDAQAPAEANVLAMETRLLREAWGWMPRVDLGAGLEATSTALARA